MSQHSSDQGRQSWQFRNLLARRLGHQTVDKVRISANPKTYLVLAVVLLLAPLSAGYLIEFVGYPVQMLGSVAATAVAWRVKQNSSGVQSRVATVVAAAGVVGVFMALPWVLFELLNALPR
jgi:hypothetical protein